MYLIVNCYHTYLSFARYLHWINCMLISSQNWPLQSVTWN